MVMAGTRGAAPAPEARGARGRPTARASGPAPTGAPARGGADASTASWAASGAVARLEAGAVASFRRRHTWEHIPTREVPSLRALSSLEAPGFRVRNEMRSSAVFRKMHVERAEWVAGGGGAAQVFHCVCFPWDDLRGPAPPLLSLDVVTRGDRMTLAVADLCPAASGAAARGLPRAFREGVVALQARYPSLLAARAAQGELPAWCREIFSDSCVLLRPAAARRRGGDSEGGDGERRCPSAPRPRARRRTRLFPVDAADAPPRRHTGPLEDAFVAYALELVDAYLDACEAAGAERAAGAGPRAAHHRYCRKQLENDKTFKVLEASFGPEVAGRYMREILFDAPAPEDVEGAAAEFAAEAGAGGAGPSFAVRGGACLLRRAPGEDERRIESWNAVAVMRALRGGGARG